MRHAEGPRAAPPGLRPATNLPDLVLLILAVLLGAAAVARAQEPNLRLAVSRELATHFPKVSGGPNELPDAPVVM